MSKSKTIIKSKDKECSSIISYLFCWDFDNTIIKGNSHDFFDDKNIIAGKASKELINQFLADPDTGLKNPKKLLSTIHSALKNGHKIAITSLSEYPEIIIPALQKLGLTEEEIIKIKIIAGPSSSLYPGKLNHIKKAMKAFSITKKESVYLIDDNEKNCIIANENGYGAFKVLAEDSGEYLTAIDKLISTNLTKITKDKPIATEEIYGLDSFLSPDFTLSKIEKEIQQIPKPSVPKKLCFEKENHLSALLSSEDIFSVLPKFSDENEVDPIFSEPKESLEKTITGDVAETFILS